MKPFSLDLLAKSLPALSILNVDRSKVTQRVVIDSRQVQQGDVYFAIRGEKHDGHDYIEQAIKAGAVVVVAEQGKNLQPKWPVMLVQDTTTALGNFAKSYREQFETLTIGITGSVGKTTTRNLVYSVLNQKFSGIKSCKNFNNQWGVPLSLFSLEEQHEFAVLEMGASHTGEIRTLANIIQPEIGIITAIGPAHLQSFGSMSHIVQAKSELFESLPETGLAIYSKDDAFASRMAQKVHCNSLTLGWNPDNDLMGRYISQKSGKSTLVVDGYQYQLPFVGKHLALLALYAVGIGLEIGLNQQEIAEGLLNYQEESHRQQIHETTAGTIIDDCYNASPLAVKAACQLLQEWKTTGSKYLVLGSMLELGDAAVALHQEAGKIAAQSGIQYLYTYGPHAQELITGAKRGGMTGGQLGIFDNLETLGSLLSLTLNTEDVLLIKGSRSMQMEKLVDILLQAVGSPLVNAGQQAA